MNTPLNDVAQELKVVIHAALNARGNAQVVTLQDVARQIKTPGANMNALAKQAGVTTLEALRGANYDANKRTMCYAFNFQSHNPKKTKIAQYEAADLNPLIVFDADHLDTPADVEAAKRALFDHPACIMAGASLSGAGVFAVFRLSDMFWGAALDLQAQDEARRKALVRAQFEAIQDATGVQFAGKTNKGGAIQYDAACLDPSRLRVCSYDPDLLERPFNDAEPMEMPQIPNISDRVIQAAADLTARASSITVVCNDWAKAVKRYEKLSAGGRHNARYVLAIKAGELIAQGRLDEAQARADIERASVANGLYVERPDERNDHQVDKGIEEGKAHYANVLTLAQFEELLQRPGALLEMRDLDISGESRDVRRVISDALARDYVPLASDRDANPGAIDLARNIVLTKSEWSNVRAREFYALHDKKRVCVNQIGGVWRELAECNPVIDYSSPAGQLKELAPKASRRQFTLNMRPEMPLDALYDETHWAHALRLLQWIAGRFSVLDEARYYISYLAQAFVCASDKPGACIDLLCTVGGTGKSMLATGVPRFIWGAEAIKERTKSTMPGETFNGDIWKGLFIVHDEAKPYNSNAITAFNAEVTGQQFPVLRKGKDAVYVPSQHRFIRTSNYEDLGYNGGTERRNAIFALRFVQDQQEQTFVEDIAPYIGVKTPESARPADYLNVRAAFCDILRKWYCDKTMYWDVVKCPPPQSELKANAKAASVTRDAMALAIVHAMCNAIKDRPQFVPQDFVAPNNGQWSYTRLCDYLTKYPDPALVVSGRSLVVDEYHIKCALHNFKGIAFKQYGNSNWVLLPQVQALFCGDAIGTNGENGETTQTPVYLNWAPLSPALELASIQQSQTEPTTPPIAITADCAIPALEDIKRELERTGAELSKALESGINANTAEYLVMYAISILDFIAYKNGEKYNYVRDWAPEFWDAWQRLYETDKAQFVTKMREYMTSYRKQLEAARATA